MDNQTKFIAEFTTNHMGNLNLLMKMTESAVAAGCDYIKMQKKDVSKFYSKEKLGKLYKSPYGKTYKDYREIFEFDNYSFDAFDEKCREMGVKWFATAQDLDSLYFLLNYNLDLYKVASVNARNHEFLVEVSKNVPLDKSIVVSLAGATHEEVEKIVEIFSNHNILLNHCVAEYPCPEEKLRLENIAVLKEKFASDDRISIGYSGHELGFIPSLAAADLGAEFIERHFAMSRHSFVHHIECSLEPQEFKEMVEIIRSGNDLKEIYGKHLDRASFESFFGMSEIEKSFLIDQTYGTKFVGKESLWRD